MMREEYLLTPQNLVYMNLCEPFYELYEEYKNILSNAISKLKNDNLRYLSADQIYREANKQSRMLFNNFLEKYTYIFTDSFEHIYTNIIFMNRIGLIKVTQQFQLTLKYSFLSFADFLKNLEFGIVGMLCNRKERKYSITLDERITLTQVNAHIQKIAEIGKSEQLETKNDNVKICKKLIIYKRLKLISCSQWKHHIETSFCFCELNDHHVIKLPIHICEICNKQFIGEKTLELYEKNYGKLSVIKMRDIPSPNDGFSFNDQSELYKMGYNVKENGLTEKQRKELLQHIIDTKQMTPFEIIRDLENAIKIHEHIYSNRFAVNKWKEDLFFVNEYVHTRKY